MFTGIIEDIGIVVALKRQKNLATLDVRAPKIAVGVKLGESIAVDGVCLTLTAHSQGVLTFDIMKESLDKTTLGMLKADQAVNLERALKASSRFGGHIVTGHTDAAGRIVDIIKDSNYVEFQIQMPASLKGFIVPKGSICVDGISLTVGKVQKNCFSVYLIPFTMRTTTLRFKKPKDCVNIEVDILARYVLSGR